MQLLSPAKLNLSLKVGPRDARGYHPVDTVIHLLAWGDLITIEDADELSVTCSRDLGIAPEQNLAFRAARAMGEQFDRDVPFKIHIEKHVPHGAGLGGGSSNAATVISELARRWEIALDDERVTNVARSLGADVPVFLAPTSCSRMGGYGDQLKEALPARSGEPVVLVMAPDAHAATAEVYRAFDEIDATTTDPQAVNDLVDASRAVCPQSGQVLDWLEGHLLVKNPQLCGSGAACYAILQTDEDAQAVAEAARAIGLWAIATSLR